MVVLEQNLPDLSGVDVAQRLQGLDPRVRVLLTSGFSLRDLPPGLLPCLGGVLRKPYDAHRVASGVDTTLRPTSGRCRMARPARPPRPTPP
jgi:hypothetical protein